MSNLLHANFVRLWKNIIFRIGLAFMFLAGSALVLKQYEQMRVYGVPVTLGGTFWGYAFLIGVVSAIFCSLFLGVEYSDGTMRNKIMVGHKRTDIYFSNLINNILATLLLCSSYILSNIILGIPLIGIKDFDLKKMILLLSGSVVMVTALCAVFTMISMLIQNKAVAPVICIVGMFLMIGMVTEVERMLEQPQYYYDDTLNPNYLEGAKRERYEFLYNFLPAGQATQYASGKTENVGEMCLYSAGIAVITTGLGIFFFRRKDIK